MPKSLEASLSRTPAGRALPALLQRARLASPAELAEVPWLHLLDAGERTQVVSDLRVADAEVGDFVCKIGKPANFWFGVVDGMLKMSNDATLGASITYTGVPPGAWFGEGTLLKGEAYRYNIEPLRRTVISGLPIEDFHWLLERCIPFNRYVMYQINERLGQFIAAREIDRISDPDTRVARNLAALFHPVLYPGVGDLLRITQQELAYLVGLSRQRVNESLRALQQEAAIRIEYGGVRVLDLDRLRGWRPPSKG